MAAVADRDLSSSSAVTKRSAHQILGGGFVADVLLWKNRTAAICLSVGATAFWILFEFVGYSALSLITNTLLLLVSIIFFWAKSATLLNRPLPPIPNLEIPNAVIERQADKVRVWINHVLSIAREIGIERDRNVFLQVIVVLWIVSFIGSWFSFFTFVYIGIFLSFTVPVLYDNYKDLARERLHVAHDVLVKHFNHVLSRPSRGTTKQKKDQ